MKTGITLSSLCPLILLIAMVVASTRVSAQQKATTLHAFAGTQTGGVADGAWPIGELVADKRGNLYGTTAEGGTGICTFDPGCGTVFELSPLPSGKWKMKIIYSFQGGTDDGAGPEARLSVDASGNLYGTTYAGGGSGCVIGCGTVFELQRVGSQWEEAVLYKFTGGDDGAGPNSPVTLDQAGNIYGTTFYGGPHGCGDNDQCGVVFELQPTQSGWTETVLHTFAPATGMNPDRGVILDSNGNLYGTTPYGGQPNAGSTPTGVVWALTRSGGWQYHVLYRFPQGRGYPLELTWDQQGNLFGTTKNGVHGAGSVFELQPPVPPATDWQFVTLHDFTLGDDGGFPVGGVTFDKNGNLYGTASAGGIPSSACTAGCGVVFQLKPSGGLWTEKVLYSFQGKKDGKYPWASVIFDSAGNLYGTTTDAGDPNCVVNGLHDGCGTVYRINRAP